MKKTAYTNNSHLFEIKYLPATNTKPLCLKIFSNDFIKKGNFRYIDFLHKYDDQLRDNIIPLLKSYGFKIIGINTRAKKGTVSMVMTEWNTDAFQKLFSLKEGD